MTVPEHPAGEHHPTVAERCLTNAAQAARRALDELDTEVDKFAREQTQDGLEALEAALILHRGAR